jgi:hypothetical protein
MSTLEQNKVNKNKSDQWIEEIDSVNDINSLYINFIKPIDLYRSVAKSEVSIENTFNSTNQSYDKNIDVNNLNESRANAFYRMIGFPVASEKGFYNPGHDPNQSKTKEARDSIDKSLVGTNYFNLMKLRENYYKNKLNIFNNQDDSTIAYQFLMLDVKPFLIAKKIGEPFEFDEQSISLNSRKEKLDQMNVSDNSNFWNIKHILKPFIVNPDVLKVCDDQKRSCVPFLSDKQSTQLESNFYLKRPAIEKIIRERLKVNNQEDDLNKINSLLSLAGVSSLEELNEPDSIFTDELNIINKNQSYKQISNILNYTKSIRYCLRVLDNSIVNARVLSSNLEVFCMPSTKGPEFGGKTALNTRNLFKEVNEDKTKKSKLDTEKAILELRKLVGLFSSENSSGEVENQEYYFGPGSFATQKDPEPQIQNIEQKQNEKGKQIISYLKNIEIITGEVSGLGLIDVLATYMALWSIDIKYLIGFLDDESLLRLSKDVNFRENFEVSLQISGVRPSIKEVLSEYERIFFGILEYVDKVNSQIKQNPIYKNRGKTGSLI